MHQAAPGMSRQFIKPSLRSVQKILLPQRLATCAVQRSSVSISTGQGHMKSMLPTPGGKRLCMPLPRGRHSLAARKTRAHLKEDALLADVVRLDQEQALALAAALVQALHR
jgi:hypothetical protein